ncbi:MAG: WbqC family protein [Bacteroidia bacterium]
MPLLLMDAEYLPPLAFFAFTARAEAVILDDREPFQKQTSRSRTTILGANGPLVLSIPLEKGKTKKTAGEVRINNSRDWQRVHWVSIRSAYGKAPFFEHYAPLIEPFFKERYSGLFEFNFKLIELLAGLMRMPVTFQRNSGLSGEILSKALDFRQGSPQYLAEQNMPLREVAYLQVFSQRYGFVPGLSILDLLMNEGPESFRVLRKMAG